jgi:hypothetical protein
VGQFVDNWKLIVFILEMDASCFSMQPEPSLLYDGLLFLRTWSPHPIEHVKRVWLRIWRVTLFNNTGSLCHLGYRGIETTAQQICR